MPTSYDIDASLICVEDTNGSAFTTSFIAIAIAIAMPSSSRTQVSFSALRYDYPTNGGISEFSASSYHHRFHAKIPPHSLARPGFSCFRTTPPKATFFKFLPFILHSSFTSNGLRFTTLFHPPSHGKAETQSAQRTHTGVSELSSFAFFLHFEPLSSKRFSVFSISFSRPGSSGRFGSAS